MTRRNSKDYEKMLNEIYPQPRPDGSDPNKTSQEELDDYMSKCLEVEEAEQETDSATLDREYSL